MLSGHTLPSRYTISGKDLALLKARLRRNNILCLTMSDHNFQPLSTNTEDDPVKIYDLNGEQAILMVNCRSLSDYVGFDDDEDVDGLKDDNSNSFQVWMLIEPSVTDTLLLKIKMGNNDINIITSVTESGWNGDECRIGVL